VEGETVRLGLGWADAATVVVSAIGVYLAFLVLLKIVGQRALAAMSSFDFAAAIALGAVTGRTVLGYTPSLGAGLLGMATLFTLQAVFGVLRRNGRLDRALSNLPVLLTANGVVLHDNLRKARSSKMSCGRSCDWPASTATRTSPPSSSNAPARSASYARARPSLPSSSPTCAGQNCLPRNTLSPDIAGHPRPSEV
jgi:hypothetical protein